MWWEKGRPGGVGSQRPLPHHLRTKTVGRGRGTASPASWAAQSTLKPLGSALHHHPAKHKTTPGVLHQGARLRRAFPLHLLKVTEQMGELQGRGKGEGKECLGAPPGVQSGTWVGAPCQQNRGPVSQASVREGGSPSASQVSSSSFLLSSSQLRGRPHSVPPSFLNTPGRATTTQNCGQGIATTGPSQHGVPSNEPRGRQSGGHGRHALTTPPGDALLLQSSWPTKQE